MFLRTGFLTVLILGMTGGSASFAGDCTFTLDWSNVPNCLGISPDGGLSYTVTIVCSNGPVAAAAVDLRFTIVGDTLVCWCASTPGPRPRVFSRSTNVNGVASFNIAAGGCIQYNLAAIPGPLKFAAEVFADGVKLQECGTVSPDAVDASGRLPTGTQSLWDPAGVCAVGLADAVKHTTPLATSTYNWCSDLNCDLAVGLSDATILTPFLAGSASCPGDAGP